MGASSCQCASGSLALCVFGALPILAVSMFSLGVLSSKKRIVSVAAVSDLCTSCAEQEAEVSILSTGSTGLHSVCSVFKQSTTGGQAVLESGCTETGKKDDYKS